MFLAKWFLRRFLNISSNYFYEKIQPQPLWPHSNARDTDLNKLESTVFEDASKQVVIFLKYSKNILQEKDVTCGLATSGSEDLKFVQSMITWG